MGAAWTRTLSVGLLIIFLMATAAAQVAKGVAAVYDNLANGSISPSALWVDASQFTNGGSLDICQSIAAAIASLPVLSPDNTPAGAVIDARNFPLSGSQAYLTCSVNPFAVSGNPNSVVLVAGGNSAGTTPGSAGGILLLPGAIISISSPWLIPLGWSVFGQGGKVTILAPSSSAYVPVANGRISTTSGSLPVGGAGGTAWANTTLGSILLGCTPTSCTGSPTNAVVVGLVTNWVSAAGLYLGTAAQSTLSSSGLTGQTNYSFYAPLMAWATTVAGTATGALNPITTGSVIQDVGLDCSVNAGGPGSLVLGCIPFWDQYGQERSQLKRIRITNFGGQATPAVVGLGIGIYTSSAQNGGPFDDIQMATANILSNNICVEVGGNGVGTQPSMRGIRGLTCTGPMGESSTAGTGVDVNTQNFSLSDAHFEALTYGVNVGSVTSSRGINISDVTGGGPSGAQTVNVVNISGSCAVGGTMPCQTLATADVNVMGIYQPNSSGYSLVDAAGSGHSFSDATLGAYFLGDGSSPSGMNNRPILTTSSTWGSSPNFFNMTAGVPITGVQGTGTWVQMSTNVPVTTTNLAKFDGNGNTVDSAVSSTSPTFSGTATVGTLAATTISGNPNFSGTPTFTNTLALNTTGTAGNVTGTVAIANGGTNATTAATNSIPNASSATAATWTTTPTIGQTITFTGTTSGSITPGCVPTATCVNGFGGSAVNSIWGKLTMSGTGLMIVGTTTVGSLPSASGNPGAMIRVSDSTAVSSEGQTCVGSSSNVALAFSNGTNWKCF